MKFITFKCSFKGKKQHYPISDEFVSSGYQQSNGGYIDKATDVDTSLAEPNQKWHFLESYAPSVSDNREASKVYMGLQCPELLLWIAEAAGVDPEIVQAASDEAKEIIDGGSSGHARNSACKAIREVIPFSTAEQAIKR